MTLDTSLIHKENKSTRHTKQVRHNSVLSRETHVAKVLWLNGSLQNCFTKFSILMINQSANFRQYAMKHFFGNS